LPKQAEPGWYGDPHEPGQWFRWWDGQRWTEHVVPVEGGRAAGRRRGRRAASGSADAATAAPAASATVDATAVAGAPQSSPTRRVAPAGATVDPSRPWSDRPAPTDPTRSWPGDAVDRTASGPSDATRVGPSRRTPEPPESGRAAPLSAVAGRAGLISGEAGRTGPPPRRGTSRAAVRRRVVAGAVAVVVLAAFIVGLELRPGGPFGVYWQGRPIANAAAVLAQGKQVMALDMTAAEGAAASHAACYFSLPLSGAHDVDADLRCGPVALPLAEDTGAWLRLPLRASVDARGRAELAVAGEPANTAQSSKGAKASLQPTANPTATGLSGAETLRSAAGDRVAPSSAVVALPALPRQPAGWSGTLATPPTGLHTLPASAHLTAWGASYQVVAAGIFQDLPATADLAALRAATYPPGSPYRPPAALARSGNTAAGGKKATSSTSARTAPLVLPPTGDVFEVLRLNLSAGEAGGAVPAAAAQAEVVGRLPGSSPLSAKARAQTGTGVPQTADTPALSLVGTGFRTRLINLPDTSQVTVVAAVPAAAPGAATSLEVSDKGLTQSLSLSTGTRASGAPIVLARAHTDDPLQVKGTLRAVSEGGRSTTVTVAVSDAALGWYAGSDGGTVPASADQAYLQLLVTQTGGGPPVPADGWALTLPSGTTVTGQALPDSDPTAGDIGFLVPADLTSGTVSLAPGVITSGATTWSFGTSQLTFPVSFPAR
jgi:hypothetical protein